MCKVNKDQYMSGYARKCSSKMLYYTCIRIPDKRFLLIIQFVFCSSYSYTLVPLYAVYPSSYTWCMRTDYIPPYVSYFMQWNNINSAAIYSSKQNSQGPETLPTITGAFATTQFRWISAFLPVNLWYPRAAAISETTRLLLVIGPLVNLLTPA